MNDRILQIFKRSPNEFISGEHLSKELECSRTAIWKHIEGLRKEGFQFEASPRRGYRLIHSPGKMNIPILISGLETKIMGQQLHFYNELDSTQTMAHSLVAGGAPEGTLVIAEQQTAGRGRMGRKWHSPKGKGIWMSLVLKPRIPVHFAPQLTLLSAVALCRTIQKNYNVPIGIKWPNDLLVNGKKVSGILLEMNGEDERLKYVVVGIGISANLAIDDYPEELRCTATSLAIQLGKEIRREELVCAFLKEFEDLYDLYHENGFAPIRILWEALSVSLHRTIRIHTSTGPVEGIAETIDDSGALTVALETGEKLKVYSGDVELR